MTLNGHDDEANGYNQNLKADSIINVEWIKAMLPPIGSTEGWQKCLGTKSSGTADTNTADKLVDSGATFIADGVIVGMIVRNTDNDSFAIVSAVDSETSLSLAADVQAGSATTDIFPAGTENYTVYATPKLPDAWVEANGQTISDADSPYNGVVIPDYNGSIQVTSTATATTDTTLTDSGASWTTNEWDGYVVELTSGSASGTIREIASNTGTVLTFSDTGDWPATAGSTPTYRIRTAQKFRRGSVSSGTTGLGGGDWHSITEAEMPTHAHGGVLVSGSTTGDATNPSPFVAGGNTGNTGGDNLFDNRPPYAEEVVIIRIK